MAVQNLSSWDIYADNLIKASWQNNKEKALELLAAMLKALHHMAEKNNFDPKLLDAFFQIGDFYCFEMEFKKAEAVYKILLEAIKEALGKNDRYVKETMKRIGVVMHMQDLVKAEKAGIISHEDLDNLAKSNSY